MKTEIIEIDSVASTQDEARARLKAAAGPVWLRARHQSGGRGRQGRVWEAGTTAQDADGNLFLSCAFRWTEPPARRALLPLLAGLALWKALALLRAERGLFLKWPNDLMAALNGVGAKVGGILVESHGAAQSPEVVVGWGVNLRQAPTGLPVPVAALVDINNICLDPQPLAQTLQGVFSADLAAWQKEAGAFEALLLHTLVRGPMAALWGRMGQLPDGRQATALGLATDGALRVRFAGGAESELHAGEFRFV